MPSPASRPGSSAPERLLVVHGGLGKTGSSALQVAFARNRDKLAQLGIHYPMIGAIGAAEAGAITSGNAAEVATHLAAAIERPESIPLIFDELDRSPGSRMGLVSSEIFQSVVPDRLAGFLAEARRRGYRVRMVFFVRAAYDWLWSAYVQNVKNHGVTASFAEWVRGSRITGLIQRTLALYDAELGADNVMLINYDTASPGLFAAFAREALGIAGDHAFEQEPERVNRSLSYSEIELLRAFNRLRGERQGGKHLSDALITARPSQPALAPPADEDLMAFLRERMGPTIEAINRRIKGGPVMIESARKQGPADARDPLEVGEINRILLLMLYSNSLDVGGAFAMLKQKVDSLLER